MNNTIHKKTAKNVSLFQLYVQEFLIYKASAKKMTLDQYLDYRWSQWPDEVVPVKRKPRKCTPYKKRINNKESDIYT